MSETSGQSDPGAAGPGGQALPQHPLVERRKPDPGAAPQRVTVITGLPGDSDRPGYQRGYLTTMLDYYAEFLVADMVHSEVVPAAQSPFPGHDATRVEIQRDATIHYTWAKGPQPVDQFDLDVRLGQSPATSAAAQQLPQTRFCLTPLCGTVVIGTDFCPTDFCPTDGTCLPGNCQTQPTDATCPTQDGPTCGITCADTCATCAQTQCLPTCDVTCANTCHPWVTAVTCGERCVVPTRNPLCQIGGTIGTATQ